MCSSSDKSLLSQYIFHISHEAHPLAAGAEAKVVLIDFRAAFVLSIMRWHYAIYNYLELLTHISSIL